MRATLDTTVTSSDKTPITVFFFQQKSTSLRYYALRVRHCVQIDEQAENRSISRERQQYSARVRSGSVYTQIRFDCISTALRAFDDLRYKT